jgi:hypothetical protein
LPDSQTAEYDPLKYIADKSSVRLVLLLMRKIAINNVLDLSQKRALRAG